MELTDTPLAPDCARVFAAGVHAQDDAELGCCCQEMGASALRSRLPDAEPSPAEGEVQRVRP